MCKFRIYKYEDNARFVLGNHSENPFICVGINPSSATNKKTDDTVELLLGFMNKLKYDSLILVNIYPLIGTDIESLPFEFNQRMHKKNIDNIKEVLKGYKNKEIFAFWGSNFQKRLYFQRCLKDIYEISKLYKLNWKYMAKLTKNKLPIHPIKIKQLPIKEYDGDDRTRVYEYSIQKYYGI